MTPARKAKTRTRKKTTRAEQTRKAIDVMSPERSAKLGQKYVCFECAAKFYDLNKPEPLCPKCGANQNARPKEQAKPPEPPPPPPPPPEPRRPPEEEEEDASLEEVDLELGSIDGDDGLLGDDDDIAQADTDED